MFDLVRELWPALLVLFLLEAVGLVGPGHLLYRRRGAGATRAGPGLAFLGFWPSERVIAGWECPPLLAVDGVFLLQPGTLNEATPFQLEAHEFVPWSELRPLEVEHQQVRCRDWTIKAPSPSHATALASRLLALREAAPATDLEPAQLRAELGLGLYLVLLPMAAFFTDLRGLLVGLLLLSFAFHLLLLLLAIRQGRRLAKAGWRKPEGVLLPLLLSPPALLRAPTALVRPLFTDWDDEALALVLLAKDEQEKVFRRRLHGARWAAADSGDSSAARAWSSYWSRREKALAKLLQAAGFDPGKLLAMPPAADPQTRAVCPLCGSEFSEALATCSGCQGPLVAPDGRAVPPKEVSS